MQKKKKKEEDEDDNDDDEEKETIRNGKKEEEPNQDSLLDHQHMQEEQNCQLSRQSPMHHDQRDNTSTCPCRRS